MDREQFARLKGIVIKAAGMPHEQRLAYLDQACAESPELRAEADSLLAHDGASWGAPNGVGDRGGHQDPMIGNVVTHYRILDKLGEGGMGVVYRAEDLALGRIVALKFPAAGRRDPEAAARILREARAAAVLDDPRICTVYDVGEADGRVFIAMALVDGETLQAMLDAGPLDLRDALTIAIRVAEALETAHAAGLSHRDIKPGNIMLTKAGEVRVLDFGIAASSAPNGVVPERPLGTLSYMSPEQVSGLPADHRSDLWSLGVVLYEMLTAHLPFDAENPRAVATLIQHAEPPPLQTLQENIPVALAAAVSRALSKNPGDRYGSAHEMGAALRFVRDLVGERGEGVDGGETRSQPGRFRFSEDTGMHVASTVTGCPPSLDPMKDLGSHPQANLPNPLTPLIGRRAEVLAVKGLLAQNRLVSICGPAGIGKSRLAIQVAAELIDVFVDGVFFVPLAPVDSASVVASTICVALGLPLAGPDDEAAQLVRFLQGKRVLLVLDSMDHLPEASALVDRILRDASHAHVLATTARQLGAIGEIPFVVRGLASPARDGAGDPLRCDAVRLFLRGVQPEARGTRHSEGDHARMGELSRELMGIPLAIELASGVGLRGIGRRPLWDLKRRIRRRAPGDGAQETHILNVILERSLRALPKEIRAVVYRFALFRGGFREPAAACIALASPEHLHTLVERSLLRMSRSRRYEMPEAVRRLALPRLLRDRGEASRAIRRFCGYFAALAGESSGGLGGLDSASARWEITEELNNIRAAWALAVERHIAPAIAALTPALSAYYEECGLIREAVRVFGGAAEALRRAGMEVSDNDPGTVIEQIETAHTRFSRCLG